MDTPQIDQPIAETDPPIITTDEAKPRKPLRLWPGVVAVALQLLFWFVIPRLVSEELAMYSLLGALVCAIAVVLWWLFFSRAPWLERIGALVMMVLAVLLTRLVVHPSIAGAGMGMMLPIFSIPFMCLALVAAAAYGQRLSIHQGWLVDLWPLMVHSKRATRGVVVQVDPTGPLCGDRLQLASTRRGPASLSNPSQV